MKRSSPGAQAERRLGATRDNKSRVRGQVQDLLAVSPHRSLYWNSLQWPGQNVGLFPLPGAIRSSSLTIWKRGFFCAGRGSTLFGNST